MLHDGRPVKHDAPKLVPNHAKPLQAAPAASIDRQTAAWAGHRRSGARLYVDIHAQLLEEGVVRKVVRVILPPERRSLTEIGERSREARSNRLGEAQRSVTPRFWASTTLFSHRTFRHAGRPTICPTSLFDPSYCACKHACTDRSRKTGWTDVVRAAPHAPRVCCHMCGMPGRRL